MLLRSFHANSVSQTTTTATKFTFQNGLQVHAGVSFQNHLQIFCVFEELLHLLTISQVHNGP